MRRQGFADLATHAVPDTACRRTLIGEKVLEAMVEALRQRGLRVRYLDEKHEFKFGNAGKLQTSRAVVIPACIGGKLVALKAAVLPGEGAETPLLLSKECLRGMKATLDMDNDVLYVGRLGVKVDLKETERGHYGIPILGIRAVPRKPREVMPEKHRMSDEVHVTVSAAAPDTARTKSSESTSCLPRDGPGDSVRGRDDDGGRRDAEGSWAAVAQRCQGDSSHEGIGRSTGTGTGRTKKE